MGTDDFDDGMGAPEAAAGAPGVIGPQARAPGAEHIAAILRGAVADPPSRPEMGDGGAHGHPPAREPLEVVNAASLADKPVPMRQEHVPGMVPAHNVTLLMGDGATGKSLLALQLCVATAMRGLWIGHETTGGRALFLTAEDDLDEVHRRLDDICAGLRIDMADLHDLDIVPLAGRDAVLAFAEGRGGLIKMTDLFRDLEAKVAEFLPCLLVLDTLADLFGGDENVRAQARQFIGALRGLAIRHQVTVMVLGHPSLSGMSSGSGASGSTGWNNSVRSRLYFERVQVRDGDRMTEPDPDIRVLRLMKANYGRAGSEIRVKWKAGMFVAVGGTGANDGGPAAAARADMLFLSLLDAYTAQGRPVSPVPSSTFAPALFSADERGEGYSRGAFFAAMNRLFNTGAIEVDTSGPPSKQRRRIVRKRVPSSGDA